MKAIVYRRYGSPDVLHVEDIAMPDPADDQVLIRVSAASINPVDRHFIEGTPYPVRLITGLRGPKNPVPGVDVAGRVERVGRNVTVFKAGDDVFGIARGAIAEYACASEAKLAIKPANAAFEQAAAIPVAGCTALQALRDGGNIRAGQRVLINGAAGGVGTFAVQIAKAFGTHVTAVCSTRNVEMVRSIGADVVIDYTRDDFTAAPQAYDVIVDLIGNRPLHALMRTLAPKGVFLATGFASDSVAGLMLRLARVKMLSLSGSRKLMGVYAKVTAADLGALRELVAAEKVTPVIDRRYTLAEAPDAIRYLAARHARGKVVITFEH